MNAVRPAGRADLDRLGDTFARAYLDDPMLTWFMREPDPARRLKRFRLFFLAALTGLSKDRSRELWVAEDGAGGAHWTPPGAGDVSKRAMLTSLPWLVTALGPGGSVRSARAHAFLHSMRPAEPHWYLEGIATRPDRQRQGVGRALIERFLHTANGMPAYLETQLRSNVDLYRRFGFEVARECDLPGGGPHMWLMWREGSRT